MSFFPSGRCLLYQLCFHRQAFEDGAKLSIINGNFVIPETDVTHVMFHDLVRQTLAVDPEFRPSCGQIQEHLGDIGVTAGWDLEAKIDFELNRAPSQTTRAQVCQNLNLTRKSSSYSKWSQL